MEDAGSVGAGSALVGFLLLVGIVFVVSCVIALIQHWNEKAKQRAEIWQKAQQEQYERERRRRQEEEAALREYEERKSKPRPRRVYPSYHHDVPKLRAQFNSHWNACTKAEAPILLDRLRLFYTLAGVALPPCLLKKQVRLLNEPHVSFEETTSFKVLPPPDVRAPAARQLLDSLRTLHFPVAFEIVCEPQTMYLLLTCRTQEAPALQNQLILHFPQCACLPHEGIVIPPQQTLHRIALRQKHYERHTKTLKDFALDPYGQLFSLLENM